MLVVRKIFPSSFKSAPLIRPGSPGIQSFNLTATPSGQVCFVVLRKLRFGVNTAIAICNKLRWGLS